MKTLFYDIDYTANVFLKTFEIQVSKDFIKCADQKLAVCFEQSTGLKLNKRIALVFVNFTQQFYYERGEVSKIPFQVYINDRLNPVTILWKSKSGRIYDLNDNDIDCDDIEFWFEGLDPLLYHKQLYPEANLPFKLQDLSYELKVTRINIDCIIRAVLKAEFIPSSEKIVEQFYTFVNQYNEQSEKRNRKDGLVHNVKSVILENEISFDVDLGSAGPLFLKKILPYMSSLNYFESVELC